MKVSFEELSPSSKIWIYSADRFFNEEEVAEIKNRLDQFLNQWHAHGSPILNFGDIYHNKFLVLFADETRSCASGCSIDSSVRFIKDLGEFFGADFFTRLEIQYLDGDKIKTLSGTKALKEAIESGNADQNTIVFDHTVKDKSEFVTAWKKPVKDSWLKRFIPQPTTA
jgi:hypothetical protein